MKEKGENKSKLFEITGANKMKGIARRSNIAKHMAEFKCSHSRFTGSMLFLAHDAVHKVANKKG